MVVKLVILVVLLMVGVATGGRRTEVGGLTDWRTLMEAARNYRNIEGHTHTHGRDTHGRGTTQETSRSAEDRELSGRQRSLQYVETDKFRNSLTTTARDDDKMANITLTKDKKIDTNQQGLKDVEIEEEVDTHVFFTFCCGDTKTCLKRSQVCDGVMDCPPGETTRGGEDEDDCQLEMEFKGEYQKNEEVKEKNYDNEKVEQGNKEGDIEEKEKTVSEKEEKAKKDSEHGEEKTNGDNKRNEIEEGNVIFVKTKGKGIQSQVESFHFPHILGISTQVAQSAQTRPTLGGRKIVINGRKVAVRKRKRGRKEEKKEEENEEKEVLKSKTKSPGSQTVNGRRRVRIDTRRRQYSSGVSSSSSSSSSPSSNDDISSDSLLRAKSVPNDLQPTRTLPPRPRTRKLIPRARNLSPLSSFESLQQIQRGEGTRNLEQRRERVRGRGKLQSFQSLREIQRRRGWRQPHTGQRRDTNKYRGYQDQEQAAKERDIATGGEYSLNVRL